MRTQASRDILNLASMEGTFLVGDRKWIPGKNMQSRGAGVGLTPAMVATKGRIPLALPSPCTFYRTFKEEALTLL